ncbi:MAG: dinitrogenase iron-molybdenum cofactor biosynthesis protein [Desulfobulbus sp.]|nr:MAG: dinitrogenase iron-molybdenum cofactor biosynthesis protein [Desulfobulbus sp.]
MTTVGIPSTEPGGLESVFGQHFGHCDLYTVVDIEDGEIKEVRTLPSVPHQQGGCMAPVQYLADNGVKILLAGGMGMRPLMAFNQLGIEVFFAGGAAKVGDAVQGYIDNQLKVFTTDFTCGGGGGPQ